MVKCPVNQRELYGKMSLRKLFRNWNKTAKRINLRNSILDNLSFNQIRFEHDADFSHSSLVNATFSSCFFLNDYHYSFDGCDLQNCRFLNLKGIGEGQKCSSTFKEMIKEKRITFLEMIKEKKITFSDVKNLEQAKFHDERIKSAIKEMFGL